ncbi:MAG: cyclic nucleotide-binding domain-containing protein [Mariprofundaceae bacterium]
MADNNSNFLELSGIHNVSFNKDTLSAMDFPILKDLSPLSMKILNSYCRKMYVSKDVELLHEGDTPHDIYFVKSGKLSVARQSGTQLKVISQLQKGDIYGEFGLLRKKARYASVFTSEESEIIRVEISAVQQVLEADQEFKLELEKLLTQRMLDSFFFTHPVFHSLPEESRSKLSKDLPIAFFKRNKRIFAQGDSPHGIYLILSGEAEVRFQYKKEHEKLLEIRRNNDILGEVANNSGTQLAYSVVTASDLDVLLLDNKTMDILKSFHPETFRNLENYINKRTARTVTRLKDNMS